MDADRLRLETEHIGPLPLINLVLDRLHFDTLLAGRVDGDHPRSHAAPRLGVLVRNLLLARQPLYALSEWATPWRRDQLRLPEGKAGSLSDDAVGRALDHLFDADRASVHTELVARAVREFELDLSELHNDTTTVTFEGEYVTSDGRRERGQATLVITFGHNKDHRPDLKQLLWSLTVCRDGCVPVHYRVFDGNTNDSPTHPEVWDALARLTGRTDFLYVADSKLCSEGNLRYIDGKKGRFLTVLPRNRGEDALFREWVQTHEAAWTEVARDEPEGAGAANVWRMCESPIPAADGFRLVWVWSSRMAAADLAAREDVMRRAILKVEELETRLRNPRTGYRDAAAVAKAAEKAMGERARRWVDYEVRVEEEAVFKQAGPGRPGKKTVYRKGTKPRFHVSWKPKQDAIAYDARTDGMFPLLTNDGDLTLAQLLEAYRFQPRLEKRHEQLKTVYGVAPMFLKKVSRIEALLFLYFVALLVQSLLERTLRQGMKKEGREALPLYPEDRACEAPTTDRVFDLFGSVQLHRLYERNRLVKVFPPELSHKQRDVLDLLGVPVEAYTELR